VKAIEMPPFPVLGRVVYPGLGYCPFPKESSRVLGAKQSWS